MYANIKHKPPLSKLFGKYGTRCSMYFIRASFDKTLKLLQAKAYCFLHAEPFYRKIAPSKFTQPQLALTFWLTLLVLAIIPI